MNYLNAISNNFRGRISILDLLNTPLYIVHELFRFSLEKKNAEEKAEKERQEQEKKNGNNKSTGSGPPINASMREFMEDLEEEMS